MRDYVVAVGLMAIATGTSAKPLLTSSEMTYARACLEFVESNERMVPICEAALADPGAGKRQKFAFLDNLATALIRLGKFDEAEQRYLEILKEDPKSPLGLNGLAWIYWQRKDYEKALEMTRASIKQGASAENMALTGSSLHKSGKGSLQEALQYLDAALAIDPKYSWALREKGRRLRTASEHEKALESFRAALDVDPKDENAHYGMSVAYSDLKKWEEAFKSINAAIEIDPSDYDYLDQKAFILHGLKRYRQAERQADVLIQKWPDRADGYVNKARALEALGRRKAGLEVYANVKGKAASSEFLNYWHADMLAVAEQYDQAKAVLQKVIDRGTSDQDIFGLLAAISIETGDWADARKAVAKGLELRADDAWLTYYDAILLVKELKPDAAVLRFKEAIKAGLPEDRIGYFAGVMIDEGYLPRALVLRAQLLSKQ